MRRPNCADWSALYFLSALSLLHWQRAQPTSICCWCWQPTCHAASMPQNWMAIGDAASAKEFGDRLLESPRSFADRTSISGAIEFAMAQLARAPFSGARQTIDISGDGTNNSGRDVAELRDQALAKGITVNGLAILSETPLPWNPEHTNPPGGLQHYYRNNVIGGPGAFVMIAKNFDSFGEAIISKIIAEVAQAQEPRSQEPRRQRAATR